MNSLEIFQLALNLPSPWHVKSIDFKEQQSTGKKLLNIDIGFTKGHQFLEGTKVHDTQPRTWRHLNFLEHK